MAATVSALRANSTRGAVVGLAIFDLDRTVVEGSSLASFGRAVVSAGIVRRRVVTRHLLAELTFKHRGLGTESLERIVERLLRSTAGLRYSLLADVGRAAAPAIAERAYPAARQVLREHRDAGDMTVLLSASPDPLVAEVGAVLGFDIALGTRIEVIDDHLTGRLAGPLCHGRGKLTRLAERFGPIDLPSCVAYADSESDLPLLRAVGTAVAVNADRCLTSAARASGWSTRRFA